ncbi:GNAT family N-acetyltransferase [Kiloniella laminariae]|uniref:L-ornithine N(alpha)-acyltransferase n=1 Tax=Kiloniella laminariae TaxID=454162 RepID=A0ABT4LJL0_9PROT|nr:GNAT family N-acyltransferase [Kiloniella laminariae]MCZ4281302.1 GNAT family N-acetyltransferase [Kiloniella laminariae]
MLEELVRPVDVTAGSLTIRLAETEREILAAQNLRYNIFYNEMSARPTDEMRVAERDFDSFDPFCDHLLVFDNECGSGPDAVVGTYRVMRRTGAAARGQFYSIDEFDIGKLLDFPGEVLELGRSCISMDYRRGSTMQLLWRGIAQYVFAYDVKYMFGCASLEGTDPTDLKLPLAYLYHNHLADPEIRPRALPDRYVSMDLLPAQDLDPRQALRTLPPLIKGYLRLGGVIGDGAVVDEQFGTTDVCVIVETSNVTDKYYNHYRREAEGAAGQVN